MENDIERIEVKISYLEAGQEEPAGLLENEGPDVPMDSDGQSTE